MLLFNRPVGGGTLGLSHGTPHWVHEVAQSICKARNSVTVDDLDLLSTTLRTLFNEYSFAPERLFNMDETGFQVRSKTKTVIALLDPLTSGNRILQSRFICLLLPVAGFGVPPLFILPGQSVPFMIMDNILVPELL
ncbi:hypothetical protein PR001_g11807 [Phytophthora rubi]|uniref:DDE-1 domain-containing protein n=1 Tax=Phytophthora rubi TaxID=129364 RepID=A0A6A3MBJ9_9STRA|nr:hypothetical protein PR001_g11807 [Phytophthora rubi]